MFDKNSFTKDLLGFLEKGHHGMGLHVRPVEGTRRRPSGKKNPIQTGGAPEETSKKPIEVAAEINPPKVTNEEPAIPKDKNNGSQRSSPEALAKYDNANPTFDTTKKFNTARDFSNFLLKDGGWTDAQKNTSKNLTNKLQDINKLHEMASKLTKDFNNETDPNKKQSLLLELESLKKEVQRQNKVFTIQSNAAEETLRSFQETHDGVRKEFLKRLLSESSTSNIDLIFTNASGKEVSMNSSKSMHIDTFLNKVTKSNYDSSTTIDEKLQDAHFFVSRLLSDSVAKRNGMNSEMGSTGSSSQLKKLFDENGKPISANTLRVSLSKDNIRESYTSPTYSENNNEIIFSTLPKLNLSENTNLATAIHEMTHAVEDRALQLSKQRKDFIDARTLGESSTKLNTLNKAYDQWEVTKVDRFVDPYIGKEYTEPRSSEAFSMAVQYLYENPVEFAKRDRDMFEWTISTLKGIPAKRKNSPASGK